jgi:hypothetical protein
VLNAQLFDPPRTARAFAVPRDTTARRSPPERYRPCGPSRGMHFGQATPEINSTQLNSTHVCSCAIEFMQKSLSLC